MVTRRIKRRIDYGIYKELSQNFIKILSHGELYVPRSGCHCYWFQDRWEVDSFVMATGNKRPPAAAPKPMCVYPSSGCYQDMFILRLKVNINGEQTHVTGPDGHPVLYCSELPEGVPLLVSTKHSKQRLVSWVKDNISCLRAFYDTRCPLFSIDVQSLLDFGWSYVFPAREEALGEQINSNDWSTNLRNKLQELWR